MTAARTRDRYEIPYTPTVDVPAGTTLLIGTVVAVATTFIEADKPGVLDPMFQGLFDKAPSQAQAIGVNLYWDNTNKYLTTTSSGNTLCAKVAKAALSADTTVEAFLTP